MAAIFARSATGLSSGSGNPNSKCFGTERETAMLQTIKASTRSRLVKANEEAVAAGWAETRHPQAKLRAGSGDRPCQPTDASADLLMASVHFLKLMQVHVGT